MSVFENEELVVEKEDGEDMMLTIKRKDGKGPTLTVFSWIDGIAINHEPVGSPITAQPCDGFTPIVTFHAPRS